MSKHLMCVTLAMVMSLALLSSSAQARYNPLDDPALIGWWACDEGEGSVVADSSANANDGAFINGDPVWVEGVYGTAIELTSPTLVEVADIDYTLTAATMAGWIKPYGAQLEWASIFMNRESSAHGLNILADYQLAYHWNNDSGSWGFRGGDHIVDNEWTFAAVTIDPDKATFYVNGVAGAVNSVAHSSATWDGALWFGGDGTYGETERHMTGALDDLSFFSRALSAAEIKEIMLGLFDPALAAAPSPQDAGTDVLRDTTLTWTAGESATQHDVYFGTSQEDVQAASRTNSLDVLVSQGQTAASFDAGRLEFGQTYYWRVDEVAADGTLYTGAVWSFTVEPFTYPIENVVATSNGTTDGVSTADKTVDGSGLAADGTHSTEAADMWSASPVDGEPITIQYEFDRAYKLYQMEVWNYNVLFELMLGFGLKDVTIEYSADGVDWTVLGDAQFAQATAKSTYTANTTVDFGGVAVKAVKITVNSGYGVLGQYGLSEVRFLYIPTEARMPAPADGQTDVSPNGVLTWRAGREAASHELYLSTDEAAVIDGSAAVGTTADSEYALSGLDIALDTAYYWKVDEVNDAEAISLWEGDVWTFSTQAYFVVEDFESYTDEEGSRIYETWEDGYLNDTGSTVGYLEEPFAETSIVNSGAQALPLFYDNAGVSTAETTYTFAASQNWAGNGIQSLSLYFYGAQDNTGQLYIKINDTKIDYAGDAADIAKAQWQPLIIDLSSVGASLGNVSSVTIGIEGSGAEGVLYVDDIRLYPKTPEFVTPVEPDPAGLVLYYGLNEGSGTTVTDGSGNGNNGTLEGDPTWITGAEGGALHFDGTLDYIATGKSLLSDLTEFTIACWLKGDLALGNRSGLIGQNDCIEYGVVSSNTVQIYTGATGGVDLTWGYDAGADWHHIVAVGNGETVTLYLDGKYAISGGAAITGTYGNSNYPVNIGGGGVFDDADNWFTGDIDEIYIYQRALSAAEVAGLAGRTTPVAMPF